MCAGSSTGRSAASSTTSISASTRTTCAFTSTAPDELAHYARDAYDIQYRFPFGWQELEGIHNRTDYDLKRHMEFAGKDLSYLDESSRERYVPFIIETAVGLTRSVLMALADAYTEDEVGGERRVLLRFHPRVAPITAGSVPLVKKDGLAERAREIEAELRESFATFYDQGGAIGRRYRRQDEIGTPFCVTVDYQSMDDDTVTVRFRDSTAQERVAAPRVDRAPAGGDPQLPARGRGVTGMDAFATLSRRGFVKQTTGCRGAEPAARRGSGHLLPRHRSHGTEPARRPPGRDCWRWRTCSARGTIRCC